MSTETTNVNEAEQHLARIIECAFEWGTMEGARQCGGRPFTVRKGYRGDLRASVREIWKAIHGRYPTTAELNAVYR